MTTEKKIIVTVDALILRLNNNKHEILMIKRSEKCRAFPGALALCGGKVDVGEDPEQGMVRELKEETSLDATNEMSVVCVRGAPDRDPRGHYLSICYNVTLKDPNQIPVAGSDAGEVMYVPLKDIFEEKHKLAFDHLIIVQQYAKWIIKMGIVESIL
ncbi:adp-ribose pyrophosphatase [Anaeramoeba flamelloides]|uniref:Adp-ribose pyrophosphatase n=1 Tax=Anaeramoeba flamelloides TaxID=1746091 RepID=A0AAV7Y6F9_9EUKA|nr:adp-ribose pyrophosphatase [Anaeramoeba flamelloides]